MTEERIRTFLETGDDMNFILLVDEMEEEEDLRQEILQNITKEMITLR